MGARALHHAPIRLDERVKLLLQRQDLVGRRSFQQSFLAGPDRGQAVADVLKRAQPEPDLEKGCEQQSAAEQGKRQHNRIGEIARFGVDGRGIKGHGQGENAALVLLAEVDVPLQNAKHLAVRAIGIGLPDAFLIGLDAKLARRLVGFVGKRVRLERNVVSLIGWPDLPIGPRQGLREKRLAEIDRAPDVQRGQRCGFRNQIFQRNVNSVVEAVLDEIAAQRNENGGSDGQDHQCPRRRRDHQAKRERITSHEPLFSAPSGFGAKETQ